MFVKFGANQEAIDKLKDEEDRIRGLNYHQKSYNDKLKFHEQQRDEAQVAYLRRKADNDECSYRRAQVCRRNGDIPALHENGNARPHRPYMEKEEDSLY